jgi:hypothetical protein
VEVKLEVEGEVRSGGAYLPFNLARGPPPPPKPTTKTLQTRDRSSRPFSSSLPPLEARSRSGTARNTGLRAAASIVSITSVLARERAAGDAVSSSD